MKPKNMIKLVYVSLLTVLLLSPIAPVYAETVLKGVDKQAFVLAGQCRDEVVSRFELLLKSGKISSGQLFDTFYIPIPNTFPQKYQTQYDKLLDANIQSLLDGFLKKNQKFIYFIITDVNGYAPVHNSKFTQPLTGVKEIDAVKNRTKIIFNDRAGLAAARNTSQYLLQEYARDTGEMIHDLSVPIYARGQHWGCVRVGFSK